MLALNQNDFVIRSTTTSAENYIYSAEMKQIFFSKLNNLIINNHLWPNTNSKT